MTLGDMEEALGLVPLSPSEDKTAGVHVHFVFLLPDLLLVPTIAEGGKTFEFMGYPDDSILWAQHDDPHTPEPVDPSQPISAVTVVHNFVEHRASLYNLDALLRVMPDVFPWWRARAPDLPDGDIIEASSSSSVLSMHVWNDDGRARWNQDAKMYLSDCLEQAIAAVQHLQRAAAFGTKESARLLTLPDLPIVIPCSVIEAGDGFEKELFGSLRMNLESVYLRHFRPTPQVEAEPLMAALDAIEAGHPFLGVEDLFRDAVASTKTGSYWPAIVQAATSAELLVHALARILRWEDGARPEEVRGSLNQGGSSILAYANTHVGKKIGGVWDGTKPGPVGEWSRHLIDVRNSALHAAAPVTRAQAMRGVDTAIGLLDFIKGQLTHTRILKYPLTAAALLGEPGLRARNRWTSEVEQAFADLPNFAKRFEHWRRMSEVAPPREDYGPDDAMLVAVAAPAWRDVVWVAHARDRAWAAVARLTEPLPLHLQVGLYEARAMDRSNRGAACAEPVSMAFPGLRSWERTGDWKLAYRLLPEHACLRSRDDLDLLFAKTIVSTKQRRHGPAFYLSLRNTSLRCSLEARSWPGDR